MRLLARLNGPAHDHTPQLQRFLRDTIEGRDSFFILQVGAYDGVSNDSVHELLQTYQYLRAVLLEPQPGPYAALEKMWAGSARVTPLRAALSDTTGERPLYVIADAHKHTHPFPDQVSSFYRSRVEMACSRYSWRPVRGLHHVCSGADAGLAHPGSALRTFRFRRHRCRGVRC